MWCRHFIKLPILCLIGSAPAAHGWPRPCGHATAMILPPTAPPSARWPCWDRTAPACRRGSCPPPGWRPSWIRCCTCRSDSSSSSMTQVRSCTGRTRLPQARRWPTLHQQPQPRAQLLLHRQCSPATPSIRPICTRSTGPLLRRKQIASIALPHSRSRRPSGQPQNQVLEPRRRRLPLRPLSSQHSTALQPRLVASQRPRRPPSGTRAVL